MNRNVSVMNKHSLMVQGTTSDAGKSVLVAGICRVLKRRGISVAPFKPQNMALNSAVTENGGEIGRAQAVQAQACGIPAHTDMNPVLLKPSSDTGAQVIIQGRALSTMEADSYHHYKQVAMNAVLDSYQRLQEQYQIIVVEGAGSPAEINLRDNDIANMGFAEAVDCPVIIVADIDRGGVFAHLVGTLALLSKSEQERVIGFVINRFRGDIKLLESGLDWLKAETGKPVLGVLPYLIDFYLDAEDAITQQQMRADATFTIVVPVFSRISNHTDFDALRLHPNVNLQFIGPGKILPPADLIILPGSKNVRKDCELMREYGWDQQLYRHLRYGGKVLGICGGYQILGQQIADPDGIEDRPGTTKGLGLLPIQTYLMPEKCLRQCRGKLQLNTEQLVEITGYEIHCGQSEATEKLSSFAILDDDRCDGLIHADNNIAGTYLHGLFDTPAATNAILQWAGFSANQNAIDIAEIREQQLDRLADCLEQHIDTDFWNQWGVST